MKPIIFEDANVVFGEGQEEYQDLPALIIHDDPAGTIVTKWRFSIRERIRVLFKGCLWVSNETHGKGIQHVYMSTQQGDIYVTDEAVDRLRGANVNIDSVCMN